MILRARIETTYSWRCIWTMKGPFFWGTMVTEAKSALLATSAPMI